MAVPVCNLPPVHPSEQYDLSVCATIFRSSTAELVEWLEYHLLLGVDHFFLYNIAVDPDLIAALQGQLEPYIKKGQVTLVSWPYMNCVREMETARQLSFRLSCGPGASRFYLETFLPTSIAHSAATASCFSRFKHTSRFMAHIDIDEFFIVQEPRSDPAQGSEGGGDGKVEDEEEEISEEGHAEGPGRGGNRNRVREKGSRRKRGRKSDRKAAGKKSAGMLKAFVEQKFQRRPQSAVLAFYPISMMLCEASPFAGYSVFRGAPPVSKWASAANDTASNWGRSFSPRLGAYRDSEPGVRYEVKLIVRSEAVDFVFTHFAPQFSTPSWERRSGPLVVPMRQGAVLHFRKPGGVGGTSFRCEDRDQPLEAKINRDLAIRCSGAVAMTLDRDLQQLLIEQEENDQYLQEKLRTSKLKDRMDYFSLGFGKEFISQFREIYLNALRAYN